MVFKARSPGSSANEAGSTWRAAAIGLLVSLGGVLFGYDTGIISGILAMDFFKNQFSDGHIGVDGNPDISSAQSSAIVSILSAGTFFGSLSSHLFADWIGRRWGMIVSCCVFMFGVVFQTAALKVPMLLVGRFFAGAGVGMLSAIGKFISRQPGFHDTYRYEVPMYQSETAPKWIRGAIVGAYQWAITIGLLISALVNNSTRDRDDTGSYRIPTAIQFLWGILICIGMLVLPETPRYLIKANKPELALASLSKLRGLPIDSQTITQELSQIKESHESEIALTAKSNYLNCFRGRMLKRMLTGMALQALQQMSGINFIFYYGTQFFKNSGISNPFIITMVTSSVNVLSTIPGILAVDRFGRRQLLLYGAVGQTVSQLAVALLGTLTTSQDENGNIIVLNFEAQKALVAFVCIYIFFFASTWGPVTWVVTGEIYPLEFRAKALSLTTSSLWLVNWAIAFSTPYLVNYGDGNANLQSKIFFVWFGATIIMILFVYFFVYETKGLTLEEVDRMYEEVKRASKSARWVPVQPEIVETHEVSVHMDDDKS